jgi:hypothetical protein
MFRKECLERDFPIGAQDDSTIEIARVNLCYCLAAPPTRRTQNPFIFHSRHPPRDKAVG